MNYSLVFAITKLLHLEEFAIYMVAMLLHSVTFTKHYRLGGLHSTVHVYVRRLLASSGYLRGF